MFGGQERIVMPDFYEGRTRIQEASARGVIPGSVAVMDEVRRTLTGANWKDAQKQNEQAARMTFLSIDWTMSVFRVAARSMKHPALKLAQMTPVVKNWAMIKDADVNTFYARRGPVYMAGMVVGLHVWTSIFQAMIYAMMKAGLLDEDEDMKPLPHMNERGDRFLTFDITPLSRTIQRLRGQEIQRHRSYVNPGKQVKEVARWFTGGIEGAGEQAISKAAPIWHSGAAITEEIKTIGRETELGQREGSAPITDTIMRLASTGFWESVPFSIRSYEFRGADMENVKFSGQFLLSLPKRSGETRGRIVGEMERVLNVYANAKDRSDEKSDRDFAKLREVMQEINEAARANGFTREEREVMFNQAMSRAKNFHYSNMYSQIEQEDWKEAEKSLAALMSLGATGEDVSKSLRARNIDIKQYHDGLNEIVRRMRTENGFRYVQRTVVDGWIQTITLEEAAKRRQDLPRRREIEDRPPVTVRGPRR